MELVYPLLTNTAPSMKMNAEYPIDEPGHKMQVRPQFKPKAIRDGESGGNRSNSSRQDREGFNAMSQTRGFWATSQEWLGITRRRAFFNERNLKYRPICINKKKDEPEKMAPHCIQCPLSKYLLIFLQHNRLKDRVGAHRLIQTARYLRKEAHIPSIKRLRLLGLAKAQA